MMRVQILKKNFSGTFYVLFCMKSNFIKSSHRLVVFVSVQQCTSMYINCCMGEISLKTLFRMGYFMYVKHMGGKNYPPPG